MNKRLVLLAFGVLAAPSLGLAQGLPPILPRSASLRLRWTF